MSWPHLTESWCPWCAQTIEQPRLTRWHDDGCEYQCPECGQHHTRKEGDEGIYAFFPGDIAAMTREEIPPLFDDAHERTSPPPAD